MGMGRSGKEAVIELNRGIELCETNKEKILDYVQEIKERCLNKELTFSEYEALLNEKLDGKTIQDWLEYYDSFIERCKKKIKSKKRKNKIKKYLSIFFSLLIVSILILSFVYLKHPATGLTITGKTVEEPVSELPESAPEPEQISETAPSPIQEQEPEQISETAPSPIQEQEEAPSSERSEEPALTTPSQENEEPLLQVNETEEINETETPETTNKTGYITEKQEEINITKPEIPENITEVTAEIKNETTTQFQAVIGQPVKWVKKIKLEKQGTIKIKLPKEAKNISVNKINSFSEEINQEQQEAPQQKTPSQETEEPLSSERSEEPTSSEQTELVNESEAASPSNQIEIINESETIPASEEGEEGKKGEQSEANEERNKEKANAKITAGITGMAISDANSYEAQETSSEKKSLFVSIFRSIFNSIISFLKNLRPTITGQTISTQEIEKEQQIEVTIDDNALEYEITYETEAPQAFEEEIPRGKRITISGPDELNYTNVLAFTQLSAEAPLEKLHLYNIIDETTNEKQEINFTAKDTNNNDLIDYIEWNVPSLNNQTYELIIEISKAEHLDENKTFISDIYEQVKELDEIWSEPIPDQHYVRVTFKENLTSDKDITIYPRVVSGEPKIEVYEFNKTEIIAEFTEINSNEYNKIYLDGSSGAGLGDRSQDVFDLKISGGSIEIEHIIDPIIVSSPTTAVSSNGTAAENVGTTSNSYNISTNTAINPYCEAQINVSDNNACLFPGGSTSLDPYLLINFTIPQYTTLNSINITAEANNTGGVDNIVIAIYNYSDTGVDKWLTVARTPSAPATGVEVVLTYNISNANELANFVFNNQITIIVSTQGTSTDNLMIEYIGIDVDYVDTTAPSVSILYPTATSYSLVVSELNYSINEFEEDCWYSTNSGATNSSLTIAGNNFTSVTSIEGSNTWNIYCNDTSGNENYTESVTFTQDTSYPQFSDYWDDNASLVGSGTASFNATILNTNGSVVLEINNTNYTASNGVAGVYNVSVDFDINGTWNYFWSSWSNFSLNYNVSETLYYTINNTDASPPSVTIDYPSNSSNFSITSIDINYTANDETALDSCWWTKNFGDTNTSLTCGDNITGQTWSEGENIITIYANDSSANEGSSSITFTVDTVAPTITILYPENDTYNYDVANINYSVTENSGSCWYSNDTGLSNSTIASAGTNFTGVTSIEGSNNWTVWCNDSVSNEGIASVVFGKDTITPGVYIESPTNSTYNTNIIEFNVSADKALSSCNFTIDSINWFDMLSFNTTYFNYTNSSVADGQYYANFTCNDTAGNVNDTEVVVFSVDTTAPSLSGENVNATNLKTDEYFCVNITATDTIGVDTVLAEIWNTTNFENYTMLDNGLTCDGANGDNVYGASIQAVASGELNYSAAYANDTANNLQIYDFTDLNISVVTANTAPIIIYVLNLSNIEPTENNFVTINFNFTVYDENGVSDINNASAKANFTRTGETTRENSTCAPITGENTDTEQNFTCEIEMWYWDENGDWNITTYAEDNSAASVTNDTTSFQYNLLQSIQISPQEFSFDVIIGAENQTSSSDPTLINNTGNYNATGNVQVEAISLYGANGEFIDAGNFTSDIDTGGDACTGDTCTECDGTFLANGSSTTITGAVLERGNLSESSNSQELFYYCILKVPSTISSQTYSTQNSGSEAWIIRILAAVLIVKRKKKRKIAENDKLLKAVNLIADELKQEYSLNRKEIIKLLIEKLREKYSVSRRDIAELLTRETEIPITIFSKELGALEAIAKYMKENLNLSYREIASLLQRNERTIWTAYKKARQKQPSPIEIKETKTFLPVSIFNKNLTILESAIVYLREKGIKYAEIAKLLNRDQRNIWTIYSRAVRKIKRKV